MFQRVRLCIRAAWLAGGWSEPPEETDDETILARLLAFDLERAAE